MSKEATADKKKEEARKMIYEEERQILLEGIAKSLAKINRQVNDINQNLKRMTDANRQVESVSEVWKDAFQSNSS